VWFWYSQQRQVLSSCGWEVIGIPREGIIGGMKVTGLDHHMRELVGLSRIMMESSFLWVTGKEIAAALNIITTGTANMNETMTGTANENMIENMTGIITGIVNHSCF
jgi:hypothetical protein